MLGSIIREFAAAGSLILFTVGAVRLTVLLQAIL
jgi:hypothetical protein